MVPGYSFGGLGGAVHWRPKRRSPGGLPEESPERDEFRLRCEMVILVSASFIPVDAEADGKRNRIEIEGDLKIGVEMWGHICLRNRNNMHHFSIRDET
jgi:hypothetical protein